MKKILFIVLLILTCLFVKGYSQASIDLLKPKITAEHQVINHHYYSILYSNTFRQAYCSYYKLTSSMTDCSLERKDQFAPDSLVTGVKVKPSLYHDSGYDKGHLVCQADMCFNAKAMTECFYMSNIAPQTHGFNAGIWLSLEKECRVWSGRKGDLFIFTGGVLTKNEQLLGYTTVIPEEFYKIIVFYNTSTKSYESISFLIPHKNLHDYDLSDYIVTIDAIELATGVDFLYALPDNIENAIEKQHAVGNWTK